VGKQKKQKNEDEANERQAEVEQLLAVIDRANKGDETALAEVRKMIDDFPAPSITVLGGDLAERAEAILVGRITANQTAFREALLAKLNTLRAELAGTNPNPTERLLTERVVACWLQLAHADALAAQAEGVGFAQGDYLQRRQDRAHHRYLSAIKLLGIVRRLALPIRVDVNVAGSIETKTVEPAVAPRSRWAPVFNN